MSSVFADLCKLREMQTIIQSSEYARALLRNVAQDVQTETFDLVASRAKLQSVVSMPLTELANSVRIALVQFLELVAIFLQLHPLKPIDSTAADDVCAQWLYENHTRLIKYVVLAKYLEYVNLASMGAKPMLSDIPQWAITIWAHIAEFRRHVKSRMEREYTAKLAAAEQNFLLLCPESEYEAFKTRSLPV